MMPSGLGHEDSRILQEEGPLHPHLLDWSHLAGASWLKAIRCCSRIRWYRRAVDQGGERISGEYMSVRLTVEEGYCRACRWRRF